MPTNGIPFMTHFKHDKMYIAIIIITIIIIINYP